MSNIKILPVLVMGMDPDQAQEDMNRNMQELMQDDTADPQTMINMQGNMGQMATQRASKIVKARVDLDQVHSYYHMVVPDPIDSSDAFTHVPVTYIYGPNITEFMNADGSMSVYNMTAEKIDKCKGLDIEELEQEFEKQVPPHVKEHIYNDLDNFASEMNLAKVDKGEDENE